MARIVGRELPKELRDLLDAGVDGSNSGLALVIVTLDVEGRPHPAMLSAFEVVAVGPTRLRLATYDTSRTAANLRDRGAVTIVAAAPGAVFYVKGRATASALTLPAGHTGFDVDVVDVSVDEADATREGHARIVSGIRFAGDDVYLRRARALHAALRAP